jgi:hypothetical protein
MVSINNTVEALDGSFAHAPDLNWSQVRETVRLLNLAVAQITGSLKDGDESVEVLTDSFTSMAGGIVELEATLRDKMGEMDNEVSEGIVHQCAGLSSKMQAAIIAFQFYDKITQKLTHVGNSLSELSELVYDDSRIYRPDEWSKLQNKIRSRYSMESERLMFDALMEGASVKEVLEMAKSSEQYSDDGDIELF